jgi:hypothetical protein
MIKILPALFGEVCLTTLGVIALMNGIDGAVFATLVVAIAGLGGYYVKNMNPPS